MGAFRETLSDFGLPIPDDQRLRSYVGPPLWHSFGDLGYSGQLLADLVKRYRECYMRHYLDPVPFEGVPELVWDLHRAGVPVATATSKQAPMALSQMEDLGLAGAGTCAAATRPASRWSAFGGGMRRRTVWTTPRSCATRSRTCVRSSCLPVAEGH